jgi:hypothetical protein
MPSYLCFMFSKCPAYTAKCQCTPRHMFKIKSNEEIRHNTHTVFTDGCLLSVSSESFFILDQKPPSVAEQSHSM